VDIDFRLTSASLEFPYGSNLVPFILFKAGRLSYAKSRQDKLDMLGERGGKILAVWPGKWSSDVFELDDRSLARRVLQQAKHVSLADMVYMEHHEGRHRVRASLMCKQCQEHLDEAVSATSSAATSSSSHSRAAAAPRVIADYLAAAARFVPVRALSLISHRAARVS
jgi:hypothetical protein